MNCFECPLFLLLKIYLLSEEFQSIRRIKTERIKKMVSIKTGISISDLVSRSRKQEIVRARNIAMKECRKEGMTLSEIGKSFNRNHSTVFHSLL